MLCNACSAVACFPHHLYKDQVGVDTCAHAGQNDRHISHSVDRAERCRCSGKMIQILSRSWTASGEGPMHSTVVALTVVHFATPKQNFLRQQSCMAPD